MVEYVDFLDPYEPHFFKRLYYIGMWYALYAYPYPRKDKFITQRCTYSYLNPIEAARDIGLIRDSYASVQIKYFYYGLCSETNTWHTVIYQANVYSDFSVEWSYGQKLHFEQVKRNVILFLVPYMENNEPKRYLEVSQGWNRHCGYFLGYDQSWTQYFVKREIKIKKGGKISAISLAALFLIPILFTRT